MNTDEIVAEYTSAAGYNRKFKSQKSEYIHPFGVDEIHIDSNGDQWYIISVFVASLDNWLQEQCSKDNELCGTAPPHKRYGSYPRYNVHGSLMSLIILRWS